MSTNDQMYRGWTVQRRQVLLFCGLAGAAAVAITIMRFQAASKQKQAEASGKIDTTQERAMAATATAPVVETDGASNCGDTRGEASARAMAHVVSSVAPTVAPLPYVPTRLSHFALQGIVDYLRGVIATSVAIPGGSRTVKVDDLCYRHPEDLAVILEEVRAFGAEFGYRVQFDGRRTLHFSHQE